jgi:transcriptional regulator with XRE-family HTH domain
MSEMPSARHTIDEQLGAIGTALRDRRVRAGLTQEDLAVQADISLGALQNLEHGKGSSVRTLLRVTRFLGTDQWVEALQPPRAPTVSPMQLLREQKSAAKRTRVRRGRSRPSTA